MGGAPCVASRPTCSQRRISPVCPVEELGVSWLPRNYQNVAGKKVVLAAFIFTGRSFFLSLPVLKGDSRYEIRHLVVLSPFRFYPWDLYTVVEKCEQKKKKTSIKNRYFSIVNCSHMKTHRQSLFSGEKSVVGNDA